MTIEENPFDHILYEFSMYLMTIPISSGNQQIDNLKVDSHLLHLRNLAYFFDRKKNCDIHAAVYVKHPDLSLVESKQLSEIYYVTNCAACHMSFERLKPDFKQKTLDCEIQALKKLIPLIKNYLSLLDSDIKPVFLDFWKNERIQAEAADIKQKVGVYNV